MSAMRRRLSRTALALLLGCAAGPACAQAPAAGAEALGVPLAAAFGVAFLAAIAVCLRLRKRTAAAESEAGRLGTECALAGAVAEAQHAQAIRWPLEGGAETATAGVGRLLGAEAGPDGWFALLRSMLRAEDAAALEDAVTRLRRQGTPFEFAARTRDGARMLQLRGVCVAAAGGGPMAAVLYVADRSVEVGRIERLTREAARLHDLLDALPMPVWLRDTDLRIAYANRAYRAAVEAAPEAPAEKLSELVAGTGRDARGLARRAQSAGAAQSERQHAVFGGQRRLIELVEAPLDGTDALAGFAIDHTRVEEAQADLRRHIAGQEEILQHVGTAIAIYGRDQSLQFFNNAFLQLWGLEEAWLRTRPRMSEVLEELRERRRLPEYADFPAFKTEQLNRFTRLVSPVEDLVHLPDGTTLRSVVVPHPFGGLLLMWEDVTDTLALERNYNTLIAVQRETLDNLYEGVAVIGANGRLRLSNPAFGAMWQVPAAEIANEPHISEIADRMADLLGTGEGWIVEKERLIALLTDRDPHSGRIERTDGKVLDFATVPLPDGAVLLSYLDVTDSINIERALRERNEALETADRLKSEFIANVSYELRTPLNTIIGFTEILAGQYFGALNDRQAEYAHGILDSSHRLLLLINDILDLATIEAGHMTLELESIKLDQLLQSVLALVRERARQKKLHLECDCPPDIGSIVADERRLKQALFNVLSNSVKFTPEGGRIVLSARRRDNEIVLTTADSGIGIPADERTRVFDKFERGSSPEARRSGAGLGLSLVKSFVELHGGRVELESEPGVGTKVMCTLPARAAAPAAPAAAAG